MEEYDTDKIDEMALALLYLTLHNYRQAWKTIEWDTLERLFEKGLIEDSKNQNKSIVFTDEGLRQAEELFKSHFIRKTSS